MDWKIFFLENKEYLIGGSLTILGIFIGWLLNLIQAIFQNKRDDALYLKRKREELYVKMYDFLMRFEKDIRIRKNTYMAKETKDLLNIIQIESIWGINRQRICFINCGKNCMKVFLNIKIILIKYLMKTTKKY